MPVTRLGVRVSLVAVTLTLLQTSAPPAVAGIFGANVTPALNYCAVERASLVAIDKQYSDAEHSRIYKSIGMGVMTFSGGLLLQVMAKNASNPNSKPTVTGQQMTYAVLAGVAASVGTYLTLKAQSGVQDRRGLALAVDADAGQQLGASRDTEQEALTLSACRQRQLADFQQRAAAAGGVTVALTKEKHDIVAAVREDIALTNRVVGRQAELAHTFTEARAMAEGQSEAKVLGVQRAAYKLPADAPTPLLPSTSPFATQPPPAQSTPVTRTVLVTLRSTAVRAAPLGKAKVIETVEADQTLAPWSGAADPVRRGWTAVAANGQAGYVLTDYISPKTLASAGPPSLAPPENVRAFNKVVLEARDEGPDRMRSLLTTFE